MNMVDQAVSNAYLSTIWAIGNFPNLDELGSLLNLAGPDQLGFWYDVGHAKVLDRLDFFPHSEWLQMYSGRIIGVHLHNVTGLEDPSVSGDGEVDFAQIAAYLPGNAIRTLELKPYASVAQVTSGLQFLAGQGAIWRV